MKNSLSENALIILEKRYLKKDSVGNIIETPEELFERVAKSVAAADLKLDPKPNIEKTKKTFYNLMSHL